MVLILAKIKQFIVLDRTCVLAIAQHEPATPPWRRDQFGYAVENRKLKIRTYLRLCFVTTRKHLDGFFSTRKKVTSSIG